MEIIDEILLGTVAIDDKGELLDVFVDVNHQGTGIGRMMMDHIEKIGMEKKYENVFIKCFVNSVGFFQKRGYVEKGRVERDGGLEITMEKCLFPNGVPEPPKPKFIHTKLTLQDLSILSVQRGNNCIIIGKGILVRFSKVGLPS